MLRLSGDEIFIVVVVLDTSYQLFVLRMFYPLQVLIVAVACACCAQCPISRSDHAPHASVLQETRQASRPAGG